LRKETDLGAGEGRSDVQGDVFGPDEVSTRSLVRGIGDDRRSSTHCPDGSEAGIGNVTCVRPRAGSAWGRTAHSWNSPVAGKVIVTPSAIAGIWKICGPVRRYCSESEQTHLEPNVAASVPARNVGTSGRFRHVDVYNLVVK
jgi:hypothetical protein